MRLLVTSVFLSLTTLLPGQSYTFSFPELEGAPGQVLDVPVFLEFDAPDVTSWAFGACHDIELLTLVDLLPGDVVLTANNGAPADLYGPVIFADGQWNVAVIISFSGQAALPAGSYPIQLASYELIGMEGSFSSLDFCVLGSPPLTIGVTNVETGSVIDPVLEPGGIGIETGVFRRGDANGDGEFNGLVDGLWILNYQFLAGAPPPCFDAADVDDDGSVNGLVDGIAALNFQFVPGSQPPPSPGPETCGLDPTPDLLDCGGASCP